MITSTRNPKIIRASKLKKKAFRDQERAFLVEGTQAVGEAVGSAGPGLAELYVIDDVNPSVALARERGVDVELVDEEVMARLTSAVTPQGIVGVGTFLDVALEDLPEKLSSAVILCAVRDPGNAGTVVRSAHASGAEAVAFTGKSVDVYNPKTVRASAGSIFHVPIVRGADPGGAVETMRARGMRVYAMTADGDQDLFSIDLSGPVAFLLGNEAWGLTAEARAMADATVRVPIAEGAESLNLAAAASVCLFEAARQRSAAGGLAETKALQPSSEGELETLIAASAHDIRSPVTGIRSLAMTLQERGNTLTEAQREMLVDGIVHDSERVDLLIRQLLDAARVTSEHLEVHSEEFEIADVVRELVEFNKVDPDHPAITYSSGRVVVLADRTRLRQALAAFLEAEIWFAATGSIEITAEKNGGMLHVEVSRRSPSVTQDEAEQLFLPRKPGTGSGSKIGLYVTRAVAEALGGEATAHSGERLVFRLMLPIRG